MNITEFAEQIVFGKTLDDKLLVPGRLKYNARPDPRLSARLNSVVTPGRIAGLEMQPSSGKNVQPPSDTSLENERSRGQLLHFLANHELLATELMALVLLKFPDAPREFRQGVLVTLQEEQEHTRMYVRRMKECGVEFGSYPLSGQFWRIVEPMQSPMEFVSRLSLTFEQANLDYSLHFAKVFRKLGDNDTAEILQKIYEDEIGHVHHGLQWFRQWKAPDQTDWEAYQQSLEFPMSPQRARGPRATFNRRGRQRAGLEDQFIDAIEVFRQSRGRAPTVRWFDPEAEAELASHAFESEANKISPSGEPNPGWTWHSQQESKLLNQIARDLELTMIALAKQDDVLLVREVPSQEFRKQLIECGFDLPEFQRFDDAEKLQERKLHDFKPWAWTPKNFAIAAPLISTTRHRPTEWKNEFASLYRKSWSSQRLNEWLTDDPSNRPDYFVGPECTGIQVNDVQEVRSALGQLGRRGWEQAIFKLDLATSGRGQRRLPCDGPIKEKDLDWLQAAFESKLDRCFGPVAIVEPMLKRIVDLSFLWQKTAGESSLRFVGWTQPLVTEGRRYQGTRLGNAFSAADVDPQVKRFLLAQQCRRLQEVADWLASRLLPELSAMDFSSDIGVDAMVCETATGELKIKPLVELNPRTTMGHVALALSKRLAPGVVAEFRVMTRGEFQKYRGRLDAIVRKTSKDGHLKSGVVYLSQITSDSKLMPILLVGKEALSAGSVA